MKRKCDGENPCKLCSSRNIDCEYVNEDKRRKRPQQAYVETLEAVNHQNQRLIQSLRDNIDNHEKLVNILTQGLNQSYLKTVNKSSESNSKDNSSSHHKNFDHLLISQNNGAQPIVIGPTSVYNDSNFIDSQLHRKTSSTKLVKDFLHDSTLEDLTPEQLKVLENYRQRYGYRSFKLFYFKPMAESKYPLFRECISLFFKWMYSSSFLFIHRESFLYFFLNNETNCEFVSMPLVYAISALGAKLSKDKNTRDKADSFYSTALRLVLEYDNEHYFVRESSISKLQTLLCLAFYDLGRGELTSCWLLAGLAFRVGFDFGFELDPKDWNVSFSSVSTHGNYDEEQGLLDRELLFKKFPFNIREVRSRIYWGSYVADRFICLLMGRPSSLNLVDVTIPDTQDIGDLTGIDDFIYFDHASDRQYGCRAFYCLKAMVEVLNLYEDISKKVFGPTLQDGGNSSRLDICTEFNLKLLQWKQGLFKELFWNKSTLKKTAHNELFMGPRYTFFIIILSINRPFVSMFALNSLKSTSTPTIDLTDTPVKICDDVIDDLEIVIRALKQYEAQFDLFSPHILSVYSTILAISVLLWRFKIVKEVKAKNNIVKKLEFFLEFLEKCSTFWTLAVKPVNVLKKRISEIWLDSKEITRLDFKETNIQNNHNDNYPQKELYNMLTQSNPFMENHKDNVEFDDPGDIDIDRLFQAFVSEPTNQRLITRFDLADALWDEAFFEEISDSFKR